MGGPREPSSAAAWDRSRIRTDSLAAVITSESHPGYLSELEEYADMCAGLVEISAEREMISLAHPTAQEFFDTKDEEFFPYAEDVISRACLTYLSFDVFSTSVCASEGEVLLRKKEHPFVDYASRY